MIPNAATRAQIRAADPAASAWLSANAGSGKTRVLTDRVAWLLLQGAHPERILCLTYTKAAASEMQNRLFERLGGWAMLDDEKLVSELRRMGVPEEDCGAETLAHARTLFARAIDVPGGLKIQTIHAFAASILRRFPLEAGVSPAFAEMEDRARVILADEVLDNLADGPEGHAVAGVAAHLSGSDMRKFLAAVLDKREVLAAPVSREGICRWFGLDPELTEADLIAATFLGDEETLCRKATALMDPGNRSHGAIIRRLTGFPWDRPTLAAMAELEPAFVNGSDTKTNPDGPKIGSFAKEEVRTALGADLVPLEAFMERLAAARPLRRALQAVDRTVALHRFAAAYLPAYDAAKAVRGWLDFDDLIRHARTLLTERAVAPWVLFRLDGGIDHLLVDEAQDTSPRQWDIIAALAEEFAAGEGARADVKRTLFVVGDRKQSIYSFQGADPDGFERMRGHFETRLAGSTAPLGTHELVHSFRSAAPILDLVDAVFRDPPASEGVGQTVRHLAFRDKMPGRIDIWPPVETARKTEGGNWYDPVDRVEDTHHEVELARRVADWIRDTLAAPPVLSDGKPMDAGDILILVRRRKLLFHRLIKEIKARGLPILGADKIPVTDQLGVKDLVALLSFLATPEDDLSLAAVLRSPLFGWSEDALFRLAHGRPGFLWPALRGLGDTETYTILSDLLDQADYLLPYDLLERILTRHEMRRRIVARLGAEAEDGIDALLAQAMGYERSEVPSLTGFLEWLAADDKLEIKRDPGSQSGQIRVMTVHGAKGLEAPVVILPDTAVRGSAQPGPQIFLPEDGPAIWPQAKAEDTAGTRALRDARDRREAEEDNRLLYVAMTRAAEWLVVGAAGDVTRKSSLPQECSWYGKIDAAARSMAAAELATPWGAGLRIETGDWQTARAEPETGAARPDLPDWTRQPAPQVERLATLSPSDLGGAKALRGDPGQADEAAALRHGRLVHLLLEHLPALPPDRWAAVVPDILSLDGPDRPDAHYEAALLAEARGVLEHPTLAPLFRDGALAEVTLTAESRVLKRQLLGQIDRLIVDETRVLAVDFKTNQLVPATPEDTPEGIKRQMGAYAEMLAGIYPGHRVETAILWTKKPLLMDLPHDHVMAALQRAEVP